MNITHVNSGEVRFNQRESIINYGNATITTYNLVNCIAIGGRFTYTEEGRDLKGIFFTHESPTDKHTHKAKLLRIKDILKDNLITDIYFFRIEPSQASTNTYADGSTTEGIIAEMISFTRDTFGLAPNIVNYVCDLKTFRCGKASISVEAIATNLEILTVSSRSAPAAAASADMATADDSNALGTFEPIFLKNEYGDIIIKCPECGNKSGSSLKIIHNYGCPNKGKKANLSHKPAEGGSRNKKRKTNKSSKKSQRRITRHSKVRYK